MPQWHHRLARLRVADKAPWPGAKGAAGMALSPPTIWSLCADSSQDAKVKGLPAGWLWKPWCLSGLSAAARWVALPHSVSPHPNPPLPWSSLTVSATQRGEGRSPGGRMGCAWPGCLLQPNSCTGQAFSATMTRRVSLEGCHQYRWVAAGDSHRGRVPSPG